jgi:hypothetical protein
MVRRSGNGKKTCAQLGRDGVPAQCQLQPLGHRAQTGSEDRLRDGERVADDFCRPRVVGVGVAPKR